VVAVSLALSALRSGASLPAIRSLPAIANIIRARFEISEKDLNKIDQLHEEMVRSLKALTAKEVPAIAQ